MEKGVIGSLLVGGSPAAAFSQLEDDDFYVTIHKDAFRAAKDLFMHDIGIDIISLAEKIESSNERVDDAYDVLSGCVNYIPTPGNLKYYVRKVKEVSVERARLRLAKTYSEGKLSPSELISGFEDNVGVAQVDYANELVEDTLDRMQKIDDEDESLVGIPTGFQNLDRVIGGLRKGELIVLASRPGMGKSILALNLIRNLSVLRNVPTGIFSYEMQKSELMLRLMYCDANVDSNLVKSHRLTDGCWKSLVESAEDIKNANIFISDNMDCTIWDLFNTVKLEKDKRPDLALVVVDYIQLMNTSGSAESREREIAKISRGLKKIAKRLDVTVIAISQLNRQCDSRKPPIPKLSDLRESGSIEQDADIVMLLYREGYYFETGDKMANVIIAKNRNGFDKTVNLEFDGACMRFSDTYYG